MYANDTGTQTVTQTKVQVIEVTQPIEIRRLDPK